ncbi:membrane protein [Klebsiella sp. WP7-S18-CRE-02]|nr:membrane protein [Klebsiella sp. WP3-W18-ESBL-02]BBR18747.1 membrane protein [Klebsiella sp. WP3-S18-ESBL-05]BBR56865.1 membrane protein [Klebsiella sp. WP4-W18-ESBL-05]BBS89612.1 membrane protein [Klebsiella sp. WP7-S18-CRE-02]BBS94634.1 membrane protein [Klebsiella sp. WP7-S18-CRE-03]BBS99664.1 membrane protein [Klebsiella sp. WP7-S18-ESBL-04]BBT68937.1 membrane protein [Klebsiella sp. WP8-S18-ESBL-06]
MMMMKSLPLVLAFILLAGCSSVEPPVAQKTQSAKINPARSLTMEQLCKDNAAARYNTAAQKIDVTGFERFQGSYELRGYTARNESFVCSFDADGGFLHLSMR